MASKKQDTAEVEILRIDTTTMEVCVVGMTPLLCNSMSAKVQQELLLPATKKNRAEKETTLKHNPVQEYRNSIYRSKTQDADTLLIFPGGGMKKAIAQAAVDLPGAAKAQIGRLCKVQEIDIPVYGVPQLHMATVRQAGMGKAPDVRTRAVVPEWAAVFHVTFVSPNLTEQNVANLIAAAGLIVGIGDGRAEKGALNFGEFALVEPDDPEFLRIVKTGGRVPQEKAMETPTCYDSETEALLAWWEADSRRRGLKAS